MSRAACARVLDTKERERERKGGVIGGADNTRRGSVFTVYAHVYDRGILLAHLSSRCD